MSGELTPASRKEILMFFLVNATVSPDRDI